MTDTVRRPTRQRAAVEACWWTSTTSCRPRPCTRDCVPKARPWAWRRCIARSRPWSADGNVDMMRTDDGEAVYRRCSTGHHHHLVCRSCGRTVEVEGPAVERWADKVSADNGFSDVRHTLEIFGTCSACQT